MSSARSTRLRALSSRWTAGPLQRADALLERMTPPRLAPALAIALLVGISGVVFVRQLLGHWTFPWDFTGPYTASPPFVAATMGTGHPLSWTPFVASGFPVDVNPQAGVYFPLWWVLGRLGVTLNLTALTCVQVAHVCFGGLGILVLARSRRLALSWATVAAVAYVFFGGFYGEAQHADFFRGFAYLPWLLWTLTPAAPGQPWRRLALLPLIVWLLATGAYPGQLLTDAFVAVAYLGVGLRQGGRQLWRRYRWALLLAALASVAACLAVLFPYLLAQHRAELYRAAPATATVRAAHAFGLTDLFGLYLNSFAWHADGTVTSWSLAVPVLMGLVFVTARILRRQLPLTIAGAVALVLATTPKIGPIGKAMVAVSSLFPSRFPAADAKAAVAVTLVVLGAEGWSELSASSYNKTRVAVLVGGLLVLGAVLAPAPYAPVTQLPGLLVAVVLITGAVAFVRPSARVLGLVLVLLIAADGVRETRSYLALGSVSSWQAPPSSVVAYRARDVYVAALSTLLRRAPATRPARLLPTEPDPSPTGTGLDSWGWVAEGYHMIDYFSTIERVRWNAVHNPVWFALLRQPWHAYVFPCPTDGCPPGISHLPSPSRWNPSPSVRTVSYGAGVIVYRVNLRRPALMVENELAINGWHSSSTSAKVIDAGIPLRVWRLSAGDYRFTARYQDPGRPVQESAAGLALIAWSALLLVLRRAFREHPQSPEGAAPCPART